MVDALFKYLNFQCDSQLRFQLKEVLFSVCWSLIKYAPNAYPSPDT